MKGWALISCTSGLHPRDAVTYDKKNTYFSLYHWFLAQSSPNPYEFLRSPILEFKNSWLSEDAELSQLWLGISPGTRNWHRAGT
jgi:hypothetical protein